MIQNPGHSAFPSGHATEAYAIAVVLSHLAQVRAAAAGKPPAEKTETQLKRQAFRIAVNRTVAGVHFPVDSAAGAYLGMALGTYFVARMSVAAGKAAPEVFRYDFDGRKYSSTEHPNFCPDFDPRNAWKAFDGKKSDNPAYSREGFKKSGRGNPKPMPISATGSEDLGVLWASVLEEWT